MEEILVQEALSRAGQAELTGKRMCVISPRFIDDFELGEPAGLPVKGLGAVYALRNRTFFGVRRVESRKHGGV